MKTYLAFADGRHKGHVYQVFDQTVIGRDPSSDLPVQDPATSSSHCQLLFCRDSVVLRDLNSTNGTRVNGRAVSAVRLCNGDEIRIGNTKLSVEVIPEHEDVGYVPLPAFMSLALTPSRFPLNAVTQQLAY